MPLGRSPSGALVGADRASGTVPYVCPGCDSPLTLRRGEVRSAHFAHRSDAPCAPETALHRGAKALLERMFRRRLRLPQAILPRLEAPCSGAGMGSRCPNRAWFQLADLAYDEVAVERATAGGLRPDVLLLRRGEPVLAIEVRVTHAVDDRKATRTTHPWVELEAGRILASPRVWRPGRMAHPWTGRCRSCQWMKQVAEFHGHPGDDPFGFAAELAATLVGERLQTWLAGRNGRGRPKVSWRCPSCRRTCRRYLRRERLAGLGRCTALGPCRFPEVRLRCQGGPEIAVQFENGKPGSPGHPVRPLGVAGVPILRLLPDVRNPLQWRLCATNRPLAFRCDRCGGDCAGILPPSWTPTAAWPP